MSPDPTVEVIFGMDFSSRDEHIVSVLLGMFSSGPFSRRFPRRKGLPAANIPTSVRRNTLEFKYQPAYMLQGDGEALLIGDRMFGFSVLASYADEDGVAEKATALVEDIAEKKEMVDIERVVCRAVGVVETDQDSGAGFDRIHFQGNLAGYDLSKHDLMMKFEMKDEDGLLYRTQLNNNTTLSNDNTGDVRSGLLVDVFTERDLDLDGIWSDSAEMFRQLRAAGKSMLEKIMKRVPREKSGTGA